MSKKFSPETTLWLGSQASYEVVVEAQLRAYSEAGGTVVQYPEIMSKQGNVGVIDIRGSLVNGEAGFMSYFGVTGYADIRNALAAAVSDPSIGAILLNIDSGGGAVAGVHETAQLIARVNKIKPVISYTGGTQASAALWLGSSARTSYVAETGIVGSLGIVMVHAERSKQLEADGIKVTVIRAGTEKAAATPYEPLSETAKKGLEEKAQVMYSIFLGHVAAQRGLANDVADKQFGQGREFIGQQAVTAGLVDAVGTLEDAFVKASSLADKAQAKQKPALSAPNRVIPTHRADNLASVLAASVSDIEVLADNAATFEGTPMPKPLTQEQLAAMAAGVSLEASEPVVESAEPASPAPAPAAEVETPAPAAATELTNYLTAQVATLQAELLSLKLEAKTKEDALTAATANVEALATIARNSLKTMTISLKGDVNSLAAIPVSELAAAHSKTAGVFVETYKMGAVAATSYESKPTMAALDPRMAAIAAKLPSGKR